MIDHDLMKNSCITNKDILGGNVNIIVYISWAQWPFINMIMHTFRKSDSVTLFFVIPSHNIFKDYRYTMAENTSRTHINDKTFTDMSEKLRVCMIDVSREQDSKMIHVNDVSRGIILVIPSHDFEGTLSCTC